MPDSPKAKQQATLLQAVEQPQPNDGEFVYSRHALLKFRPTASSSEEGGGKF